MLFGRRFDVFMNIIDVRWTLKQRGVISGLKLSSVDKTVHL